MGGGGGGGWGTGERNANVATNSVSSCCCRRNNVPKHQFFPFPRACAHACVSSFLLVLALMLTFVVSMFV